MFISDSIYVTFQEKTLSFEKVKIASSISLDAIKYKLAQKVRCSSFDGTNECSDLTATTWMQCFDFTVTCNTFRHWWAPTLHATVELLKYHRLNATLICSIYVIQGNFTRAKWQGLLNIIYHIFLRWKLKDYSSL